MGKVPSIKLNNGVEIPQFGFGVFQVPAEQTAETARAALDAGYRHIDTAQAYGNEEGVGRALADSGLAREEVFITTKLANEHHGEAEVAQELEKSLERLGTDHVDLYLIHWPQPGQNRYVETWRGFEKVLAEGRARAIGVSNFTVAHLRRLAEETGTVPAVNQVELHPHLTQAPLREFHARHGIVTEAWSPLARGGDVLTDPRITAIAEAHGKTPAQVILRWHLQVGTVVIPKSVTPSRIAENLDVFGFTLADDEIAAIEALDKGSRVGPDPDQFDRA